jgi:hypothetical protein
VAVPQSAAVAKAEVNGWVPFVVIVESGKDVTLQNISVPVTSLAAAGNATAAGEVASRKVTLPPFGAFYPSRLAGVNGPRWPIPQCHWKRRGREVEKDVHIGEFHLIQKRGLTLAWDYGTEADTTMSVGYSLSPDGNYNTQGTYTATNSIATDSGFSVGDKTRLRYVDGQAYFQRYWENSLCPGKPYRLQLDHMVGNSYLAGVGKYHTIAPKPNPYHGCLKSQDPWGNAAVYPGTHYSSDRSRAITFNAGVTVYGFTFSQSTGYTKNINADYQNGSHGITYVCGKGYMPDVPVIYNGKV